jgi:hypothetical protein
MEIKTDREEMIFRKEYNDKVSYSIGLSKKKEDGSYENGYMPVRFRKGTELKDKTKIKIKEAWLDFYKIDKKTIPYVFINKFELPSDAEALRQAMDDRVPKREKTYIEQQSIDDDMGEYPFY